MSKSEKSKDLAIETLRGIAIILMVAGHVIGSNATRGLKVSDDSIWRYFYYMTMDMRMPLFAAISGYLFGSRPVNFSTFGQMFSGKVRRIIVPFFVVATCQFLIQASFVGANQQVTYADLWKVYFFPYAQFWFSQAIFLIFIFTAIQDCFSFLSTWKKWLFVFLIALLLGMVVKNLSFFSLNGFGLLLPAFLLGLAFNRFSEQCNKIQIRNIVTLLFFCVLIVHHLNWVYQMKILKFEIVSDFIVTVSGLSCVYLFFYFRRAIEPLAKVGYFAYSIFLFHVFGTASTRFFLQKLGIDAAVFIFPISLFCGLLVPIVLEKIFMRWSVTRRLFLGLN